MAGFSDHTLAVAPSLPLARLKVVESHVVRWTGFSLVLDGAAHNE